MRRPPLPGLLVICGLIGGVLVSTVSMVSAAEPGPVPGTAALRLEGDLSSAMIDDIDRFLLRQLDASIDQRGKHWQRDASSPEKYAASVEPNRQRLKHILGVRDPRVSYDSPEFVATVDQPALVAETAAYAVYSVRWPVIGDVWAEGLLFAPRKPPAADVVALPDADQTPEMLAGLAPGTPPEAQFARRLAESGCRVLVPTLVSRQSQKHRNATLTNREYIFRAAYELGRHVIGYEIQKVLAAVDWFARDRQSSAGRKIGVIGYGEGGLLALAAAAIDPRIEVACVSGYFDSRQDVWQEPADRNVFGLLEQFGDAEIASLVAPRRLVIEAARGAEFVIPPGTGGAPGRLVTPPKSRVEQEVARAKTLIGAPALAAGLQLVASGDGSGPAGSAAALEAFLSGLNSAARLAPLGPALVDCRKNADPQSRQARTVYELNRHSQRLLDESAEVRQKYFAKLDTRSLEKFQQTIEPYRAQFYNDVIGRFDLPLLPAHARSRQVADQPKHVVYEVVLDVFPDVMAYGLLLVPKSIAPGEKRPVVVCQHGLEGRPQDCLRGGHKAYDGFASALADEGFITFAPQNPYIFQDRFRTLQRKSNPLGKTLFSIIVPQHQQIVDWLGTLPFVDRQRIAFYGLSYGGKSAMRIPPLVAGYCLSICSGDFNEWVWKNASVGNRYSYMGTSEYEIFEFDLGSTFNYAEMAALIAPRPFMVERGHFDGVAPDERVAFEFAKVRFLYAAKLGIGDRLAIEWFPGPHMIHSTETFEFLRQKLNWRGP